MKKLSKADFFNRVTGVADYSGDTIAKNNYTDDVFIDEAIRLISEVPRFFSDQLDRMSMWDRIGNGIGAAVSKSDGDFRLFVNYLVEYVKADFSKFACSDTIQAIIATFELRDKAWQRLFVENCQKYSFLIIAKARQSWQNKTHKEKLTGISEYVIGANHEDI